MNNNGRYTYDRATDVITPCESIHEWGLFMERSGEDRVLRRDDIDGAEDMAVSTVFLGLDHDMNVFMGETRPADYMPLIFETMIFGGEGYIPDDPERQQRFRTSASAIQYHYETVALCLQSVSVHAMDMEIAETIVKELKARAQPAVLQLRKIRLRK